MRKRIFALLLAAAMVLGLAACASSGQNDEKKSDEKVSGESSSEGAEDMTFDELKEAAKGSTVTFYEIGRASCRERV